MVFPKLQQAFCYVFSALFQLQEYCGRCRPKCHQLGLISYVRRTGEYCLLFNILPVCGINTLTVIKMLCKKFGNTAKFKKTLFRGAGYLLGGECYGEAK